MFAYLLAIFGVVIFGNIAVQHNQEVHESLPLDQRSSYKKQYGLAFFIAVAFIIFVGGFRYYVGTDFGGYYKFSYSWEMIKLRFEQLNEPLLPYITYLVRLVKNDGIWVIFIEQLITVGLVAFGIWQYDDDNDFVLMLIFYILISWTFSFNGVRQAMAGAVIFAFTAKKTKYFIIQYAMVCFIAFLIHKSALLMFPFLLLAQRKISISQIVLLVLIGLILPRCFEWGMSFMELTYDNGYAIEEINFLRVLVAFAPLALLFFIEDFQTFSDKNYFVINMVIINAILLLTTRNSALLNRFSYYTSIYTIVYLPKALKALPEEQRKIITICAIILYFLFFIREEAGGWALPTFSWSFGHFGEF